MAGALYHMSLPAPILQRGFWLYVWKVKLPAGQETHYVGMTGDTGSGIAQSAMNRVSAHLGRNLRSNALQRYLRMKRNVDLESCLALDFFAFGPVYPDAAKSDYQVQRGKVAAIEKHLWAQMKAAGYDMLNDTPRATAPLDEDRWSDVCTAFHCHFDNLSASAHFDGEANNNR